MTAFLLPLPKIRTQASGYRHPTADSVWLCITSFYLSCYRIRQASTMQDNDEMEYRYTLLLPLANSYSLDTILKFIAAADYQYSHGTPDDASRALADIRTRDRVIDPRTIRTYLHGQKFNLIHRLLRDAAQGKYRFWNWTQDRIIDPPQIDLGPLLRARDETIQYNQPPFQMAALWAARAFIFKSDVIKFCLELRIKATFEDDQAPPPLRATEQQNGEASCAEIAPSTAASLAEKATTGNPQAAGTVHTTEEKSDVPWGRQRWLITRLAIEAAWELENELGRLASAAETIEKLQEWTQSGKKDGCLIRIVDGGVEWRPKNKKKGDERTFDVETCAKALQFWHEDRAKPAI
jgi:hypothetical protein